MATTSKKPARFRPGVESLESMMLLSHATADLLAVHAEARKPPAVVAPVDVALAGTLHGSGKLSGTVATASGSGRLGKVGVATFNIKANVLKLPSKVSLSTGKGNITLTAVGPVTPLALGYTFEYEVVGGTKSYAKATGSGTVTATYVLHKGNNVSLTLAFS